MEGRGEMCFTLLLWKEEGASKRLGVCRGMPYLRCACL